MGARSSRCSGARYPGARRRLGFAHRLLADLPRRGGALAAQKAPQRQDQDDRDDDRTREAPLTDVVNREELAAGQIGAEAEADECERDGGETGRLAFGRQQRGEDGHVADQTDQRHRHADELRILGCLHDLAAAPVASAQRLDARVVDVGEVGRHADPCDGEHEQRDAKGPCAHRRRYVFFSSLSIADVNEAGSVTEEYSNLCSAPPVLPSRKEGVPVKPWLLAAWASVVTALASCPSERSLAHFAKLSPGTSEASFCRYFSVT